MCLTPRNRFEYIDKLQRNKSYTTYNAELDACDYLDINEKIDVSNNDLFILQLNIRGMYSKLNRLKSLIEDHTEDKYPDIILLCETWHSKNSPVPEIKGYRSVHKYREHKKGGGVAILISENLKYKPRPDLELTSEVFEHCIVEVKLKTENIICCSGYRAPNTDVELFLKEYGKLAENINKVNKTKTVIGIDHNLDLLNYAKHRPTREFVCINEKNNLVPGITRPTRITNTSATLIDNIFVTDTYVPMIRSQIIIDDISDHLPTCVILENINIGTKERKRITTRIMSKNSISLIRNELRDVNWASYISNCCSDSENVNTVFNCIHSKICASINKYAPLKERIVKIKKFKSESWITKGIKRSSIVLKNLYKKTLSTGCDDSMCKTYIMYRNCFNRVKRTCKMQYFQGKCNQYKNNTKKLWELINKSIGKTSNKNCVIDKIKVGNVEHVEPVEIANDLCKYYSNIGESLANSIPTPKYDSRFYLKKITPSPKSLYVSPTTKQEIINIINNLPNKNSSGHDNINNILLKNIKNEIAVPLERVFNVSLEQGIFPNIMKKAEVIPLYKGKERDLCMNYRPISLLLTISKILEKLMYKRTYEFLNGNNLFYNSQYGFRSKHSCENAISELIGHIIKGHEKKEHTAAIFLDLSKAFDTLNHKLLLQKLELYGIRGTPLNWFKSYLNNRYMRVKYQGDNKQVFSKWQKVSYGAPQGSCLGPLLFLVFCNDLHLNLTYLSCIQFADDTTLYYTHKNQRVLRACIEHDLRQIHDWFGANSLTLNIGKTNLLLFDYRKNSKTEFRVLVNGTILTPVKNTKFLGVMLDDKLMWKEHLEHLKVKLKRSLGMIHRGKNMLNCNGLKMLYYAQFFSHLSYCIVIWGSMLTFEKKEKLKTMQNCCVRLLD